MNLPRRTIIWLLILLLFGIFIYFRLYSSIQFANTRGNNEIVTQLVKHSSYEESETANIAVVICKQRSKEALVMVKSAVIFRGLLKLHFIIFSEYELQGELRTELRKMNKLANNSFTFQLYNLSFPEGKEKEWRELFRPCASQRLFLPEILNDIDKLLYVDTDVLFVNEIFDIWHHFDKMNSSQLAALTPEHEEPNVGWYNRFARHPYYGELGVNSGVMLMDLKKMRAFGWVTYLPGIYETFKLNIPWGDQDIINIIFFYHPDKLLIYPCRYNYRGDHCMYRSVCKDAEVHGISVVHGSRSLFHTEKQPIFKAIYDAFNQYQIGQDPGEYLVSPLLQNLKKTMNTRCGSMKNIFLKNILRVFSLPKTNNTV